MGVINRGDRFLIRIRVKETMTKKVKKVDMKDGGNMESKKEKVWDVVSVCTHKIEFDEARKKFNWCNFKDFCK